MAKTKAGPIGADRLKSFIDRIERLEEEQKAIGSDKRDVYAEAKGVGYNAKAMRKIVMERRQKEKPDAAELEADMEAYRVALGMAVDAATNGDMSLRKAAAKFGVSKSAVHRAVPRAEKSDEGQPVDTDAEEITDAAPQPESVGDDASMGASPQPAPEGGVGTGTNTEAGNPVSAESCGGVESRHAPCPTDDPDAGYERAAASEATRQSVPGSSAGVAPGPQDPTCAENAPVEDDLAIPAFLKRTAA